MQFGPTVWKRPETCTTLGKPDITTLNCKPSAIPCCRQSDYRKVEAMLRADGYEIIAFHGSAVHDRASFFGQAAIDLPQPETQIADSSYDDLELNIHDTLLAAEARKVAILWSNAHILIESSVQDYSDAIALFTKLKHQLASADSYPWVSIELTIVVFGSTANFCGRGLEWK